MPTRTTCPLSHTATSPPVPLGLDCLGKGVSQALPSSNNREEERLRVRDQLLVFCLLRDLGVCMDSCLLLLLSRFSRVRHCATPQTAARQAPPSWDSPGKTTGVGCHFLLQRTKVKSESEVAQSCPTLSDPMDCSLPGSCLPKGVQFYATPHTISLTDSPVPGILQARTLE